MSFYTRPEDYPELPRGTVFGSHFDEDDTYRMRRQTGISDWLIFFTLGGEGYVRTPAGEQRCVAGQICFLRSGVPHEYGTVLGQRWNFVWAHFQKLSEIDYLPHDEAIVHTLPEGYLRKRVYRTFQNLLHDSLDRSGFWRTLCENSLKEIILLIAQRMEQKLDARIEQSLQILAQSMNTELRIADLAKSVGLSASRLSHLFKQETGESVLEHLNNKRLQQAALLMEHMGRSATEASLDVGFNNYNHFASLFRKSYGVSPRNYLKR